MFRPLELRCQSLPNSRAPDSAAASMVSVMACFSSSLAGKATQACRRQQAVRPSRGLAVRCAASAEGEDPKFSFSSNRRSAVGYTEEDSAGQTNIFAVEPKTYVQGSTADTTGNSTVTVGAAAFVFAMAAVGAGLVVLNGQPEGITAVAPTGEYLALSDYAASFSAELGAAPALSE